MSQGNGIRARAARSKTRYLGVGNDVLPDSKNRRSPELCMTARWGRGVGATRRPLAAHRPAAQSTRRLDRRLRLASGLLLRGLIAASGRGRAGQWLQRRREV